MWGGKDTAFPNGFLSIFLNLDYSKLDNDVGRSRIRRSPKGKEKDKKEEDEDKKEKKKQKEEKDEEKVEKKDKPKKSFWVRSYTNMNCRTYYFRLLPPNYRTKWRALLASAQETPA